MHQDDHNSSYDSNFDGSLKQIFHEDPVKSNNQEENFCNKEILRQKDCSSSQEVVTQLIRTLFVIERGGGEQNTS